MKKITIFLIMLLCFLTFNVNAKNNKVTIYLFRGNSCPHCHEALEYFYEHQDKADYEVKTIEVWKNKKNGALLKEVQETFGDSDTGVPYIVIGNNYHLAGYSDSMLLGILDAVKYEQSNKEYVDLVEPLFDKYPDCTVETVKEAAINDGIILSTWDYVITFVVSFAILGGGYFLFRKIRK